MLAPSPGATAHTRTNPATCFRGRVRYWLLAGVAYCSGRSDHARLRLVASTCGYVSSVPPDPGVRGERHATRGVYRNPPGAATSPLAWHNACQAGGRRRRRGYGLSRARSRRVGSALAQASDGPGTPFPRDDRDGSAAPSAPQDGLTHRLRVPLQKEQQFPCFSLRRTDLHQSDENRETESRRADFCLPIRQAIGVMRPMAREGKKAQEGLQGG